jgi:hypothetical protein
MPITDDELKLVAKAVALHCVRNTQLEDLHSGTFPCSASGDYSDVKVVTPYGEIPWNQLSRISDPEMKALMREIVDCIYTFHKRLDDPRAAGILLDGAKQRTKKWDEPKMDERMNRGIDAWLRE